MERLVVVGNGMAGVRFLEALAAERGAGPAGSVVAIGAEPVPGYNRVLLSAALAGDTARADLALKPEAWYRGQGFDLRLGDPVATIDPAAGSVSLRSGEILPFDRLVLATGSAPIRLPLPGADREGVVTFRDLADLDRLDAACAAGAPAVVIGGGLLGIEAAYGLARRGLPVTLVHLVDRLMERQLDARAADLVRRALERLGVRVLLGAESAAVEGGAAVEALRLADGRALPCGLLVMAVGIRPETTLARTAGLQVGRGILVDDGLETSVPGIHAIGECAEHRGSVYGLVEPAYAQAQVLAARLAGRPAAYAGSLLATNLKVSGLPVFSAGDFVGEAGTDTIHFEDRPLGHYRKLVLRGDQLVGAVLVGDTADGPWYQDLIREGRSVAPLRRDLVFGRPFCEAA
ncbi:NAD(P)/FAD-dependent oxidoreductase [Prosthecomicrobium sp. N25]|uniref:NAD(P)/FAD-dependent oxidoreductase n=1 Tax=Prosthecomicrobium sp. N25 TaxID=3129254 RepID=UPI003077891E